MEPEDMVELFDNGIGGEVDDVKPFKKVQYNTQQNPNSNIVWMTQVSAPPGGSITWSNTSTQQGLYTPATYMPTKPEQMEPTLPTRKQADPIVAYKRAKIAARPYRLYGVGMHASYLPDDTAACHKGGNVIGRSVMHLAPHVGCSCGFYAMPKEWLGRLGQEYGTGVADIQVELFGRVVVHEHGWRAERQRVLGVWLDPVCAYCHREAKDLYVEDFEASGKPKIASGSHRPSSGGIEMVVAACRICMRHPKKKNKLTIGDLANEWGVEVRWGNIPF